MIAEVLSKPAGFQVIIIIDYDDGRMFPLSSQQFPKCLLPVANRCLLDYQLCHLEKSGALEVYIVGPEEYKSHLSTFLAGFIRETMRIELVMSDDCSSSVDCLRAVRDRIRGDFICIASDTMYQIPFGDVLNFHRNRVADITSILSYAPIEEPEKKGGQRKVRVDEEDQEYIGLCDDGRLVMKSTAFEIDQALSVSKALLNRCTSMNVRNDMLDMGIYVMSYWVLEFLDTNKKISSLRTELVPYLVNRQFQSRAYLIDAVPALEHRRRPLEAIETWLANNAGEKRGKLAMRISTGPSHTNDVVATAAGSELRNISRSRKTELADTLLAQSFSTDSITATPMSKSLSGIAASQESMKAGGDISRDGADCDISNDAVGAVSGGGYSGTIPTTTGRVSFSGSSRSGGEEFDDLLRCYAFLLPPHADASAGSPSAPIAPEGESSSSGGNIASRPGNSGSGTGRISFPSYAQRLTGIASFMALSRDVVALLCSRYDGGGTGSTNAHATAAEQVWPPLNGFYHKKEQTLQAHSSILGDKVTFKQCVIGSNCKIGAKCKLNNCIIMDNCIIADNCILQNTILCHGAEVEGNCNLNDCQVAAGAKVATGSKLKSEAIGSPL